jgi:MFS family permease
MGRVLLGAIIGALIGGLLGSLAKNLDASFQLPHPPPGVGGQLVSLAKLVGALGIVFGAGAGGIIGAIAGAVSAQPETRPVPLWFWCVLLGFVAVVVVACALLWALKLRAPDNPDRQNPPIEMPVRVNPPEQDPEPQGGKK